MARGVKGPDCTIKNCGLKHYAHSLCAKHYRQARIAGNLPGSVLCDYSGCEKVAFGRGLCQKHHARLMRHGDVDIVLPKVRAPGKNQTNRKYNFLQTKEYDNNPRIDFNELNELGINLDEQ